ncbi:MAG: RpiB/LacA/LacB family sugar-phosphate isomerase [Olsenella profusa]
MDTRIALACDDIGFKRKEELKRYLVEEKGAKVVFDPVKDPEDGKNSFAHLANDMTEFIQRDKCRLGVYVCGTGIGFTCQANKHWGIRAVMVSNPYTAQRARLSNNVQIIGLGVRVMGLPYMEQVLDAWYDNPFDFATARQNSRLNLLEAKADDYRNLVKPDYVAWNMGFEPDDKQL